MISVVLVGTGNVAQNLFQAFDTAADVEVIYVLGRNKEHLTFAKESVPVSTDFNSIPSAEIYILAVSDDAIAVVADTFKMVEGLVVHTSGGTSLKTLDNLKRTGVFYPLQTFTKDKIVSFKDLPLCLEATNEKDLALLQKLGASLSNTVRVINSEQRKALHIAAVFVNNFTNYMYTIGEDICVEHAVDFNLLHPLIKETAAKLNHLSPKDAQTGPAKRGDQHTINNHLNGLINKQQRDIYMLLSTAIKSNYGTKL